MEFTAYWLRKKEDDFLDTACRILGTVWSRDQLEKMTSDKNPASAPNEFFLPLSAAVNPDLIEGLKKVMRVGKKGSYIGGGEYQPSKGEEVVELGDLPPEEFLKWVNQATGELKNVAEQRSEQQKPVTIKEGPAGDDRIDRIRSQIEHSKKWRT